MKSLISHIELKVSNPNISFPFYTELLTCLGYQIIFEDKISLGFLNAPNQIWIVKTQDKFKHIPYHRQHTGINHLAFRVESAAHVDKFITEFLKPKNITTLYQSPKLFPEYTPDYYAVYFEDPDRIKLEVNFYT
jgi:catechol 2,3-dioxygenase-like lactoylglutathione lyase family enzyme